MSVALVSQIWKKNLTRPAAPFHFFIHARISLEITACWSKLLPYYTLVTSSLWNHRFSPADSFPQIVLSHPPLPTVLPPPFILTQTSLLNHTTYFSPIHLHPLYAVGQLHTCYVFTHGSAFMGKIGCSRRPSPLGNTASSLWWPCRS